MNKFKKPIMEVYRFGDRDVIATSALPDYHMPQDPLGPPESPEMPVGMMLTAFQGRNISPDRDLFGMMQNMMLADGSDQNQDRILRSN